MLRSYILSLSDASSQHMSRVVVLSLSTVQLFFSVKNLFSMFFNSKRPWRCVAAAAPQATCTGGIQLL